MVQAGFAVGRLAAAVTGAAGRAATVGRVTTAVVSGLVGITVSARVVVTTTRVSVSIAGVAVPSITAIMVSTPTVTTAMLAIGSHP